ncbi:site-specific integrase [Providencia alcalifaciens]|uniref:Site-specific recombinase, phage integrase family n=1 Tax=Providencia alcalifaciens 205/92 TaxID=1256988 RepID=A0AAV3M8V2_9GAMM|nr:site-specific integrase [Providencia alcalifaciens]EUD12111.1 site-specific recombinase, phage integrase family [Providencia alcalifaciens 205/92]WGZ53530.1 site-specific integrase [Providencia alcalifaciens]
MLTDAKLRKLHNVKRDSLKEFPDGQGLSARVTTNGMIVFQYRYRFNRKPRRMTLGEYGVITLKEARDLAQEARKELAQGNDPIITRSMTIDGEFSKLTISECIKEWIDSPQAQKLVKLDSWKRAFDRHVIPSVGKMIAEDMTVSHWRPMFKRMRDNGAATLSTMMLSKLKQVLSYCIRIGKLNHNSLSELRSEDVGEKVGQVKRYLSDKEIALFWKSVDKTKMSVQNKIFIKLVLLTGCRGVELRMAKKSDFDLDNQVWHVPAEISKTREPFNRGLSNKSVSLLKEAFEIYPSFEQAFPPAAIQEDRPMSASVLLQMAKQVGVKMGVDDWSTHDLRRTAKTKMGELGVLPHVSEKILGHKLAGILAVYDRYEYIKEQIEAANMLADHIEQLSK